MYRRLLIPLIILAAFHPRAVAGQLPQVSVERRLAQQFDLAVEDTVLLRAEPHSAVVAMVVAAIHEPLADPAKLMKQQWEIRLHLPDMERFSGYDQVDRLSVALIDGADPAAVAAVINRRAFGFQAIASEQVAARSSQTFRVVSRFHGAIGLITVVASAVFLLCVMLLKVDERRLDAAAMRLVGLSRRTVLATLWLEASAVALVGSVLGLGLGWLAGWITNAYYQRLFDTGLVFSVITPGLVLFSLLLSLVLGAVAGAAAAWRLARVRPLDLWRRS